MTEHLSNSKQKILLTGSTGFVGTHLLYKLQKRSFDITVSTRNSLKSEHLSSTQIIQISNIDSQTDWQKALAATDVVIHLAARAHQIKETSSNPIQAFREVNTLGTSNLAKQAIQAGVKQFIFVSSIGAMTTLSSDILTENSPCNPDTPYGQSKLEAEMSLIRLASDSDMSWTILRPTLIYGPNNPGNMLRLLKLTDRGLPLPLGGVQNHRSFLFVGNFVDAITQCISNPKAFNQTFIVSDSESLSTPELIKMISHFLKKKAKLVLIPPAALRFIGRVIGKEDTVRRLIGSLNANSEKICQTLDWNPPYTCREGIQETCDWYLKSFKKSY